VDCSARGLISPLRDRPAFPIWVLYGFQLVGIRLPGWHKSSDQFDLIQIYTVVTVTTFSFSIEVLDSDG
jgi:hypothetical protein